MVDRHPGDGRRQAGGAAGDGTPPPPPWWRNSPSVTGDRSYGGGDDVLRIDGEVLRVTVRPRSKGVAVFACVFVPTFTAVACYVIPETPIRVAAGFLAPFAGIFTFGIIYAVMRHHEGLGDYLVIDRAAGVVGLPRLKAEFPLARVVGLQLIRGRSKGWNRNELHTDFNLLVDEEPGGLTRYHVMGAPGRRTVEQVVAFSGLPLADIDLGWRGYRDADSDTAGA